ncbi:restriction endonuclease subunit S [Chromohalobacter israelensis]|uniref:restriction endonuclease subunit S n=1 Tax=Chromohalobacter israelensis TaxID=141390 RepID=UPI001CC3AE48|nr:restriction endonuclease subunit S [Chromohalobacter salexigens]MBZ5877160.1 restriction endonuclease subunit S [Chromohalobacter salexigens]
MSSKIFPVHWQLRPLSEVVDALIDYRGKTPKKSEAGIPLVTAKIVKGGVILPAAEFIAKSDYDTWMVRGRPKVGDVVVTTEAPLGEVAQIKNENIALAQRIVTLRGSKDALLSDYLLYLMQSPFVKEQLEARSSGSTVKGIKQSELRKILLPIPPVDEQEWIGYHLKSIDNKIQLNQEINQTLEQMAQALFKSWFVDFEPVKAKIAARERWQARQPENESASPVCYAAEFDESSALGDLESYMNRAAMQAISGKTAEQLDALRAEDPEHYNELYETAALFPSAMQESELGETPEGWEIGSLSELIEFNPRRTLQKGVLAPYLDMKNVPTSGHLAGEVVQREMGSGTKFINGDTLLARITPCLENGKVAFVDFLEGGEAGWGSTEYIVLRPQSPYPVSLGYFIARSEKFRAAAIQSMTGTSGRQRADAKLLASMRWLIYPSLIVERFDRMANSYLKLARSFGYQDKALEGIRDALLPKLLSGELACSVL